MVGGWAGGRGSARATYLHLGGVEFIRAKRRRDPAEIIMPRREEPADHSAVTPRCDFARIITVPQRDLLSLREIHEWHSMILQEGGVRDEAVAHSSLDKVAGLPLGCSRTRLGREAHEAVFSEHRRLQRLAPRCGLSQSLACRTARIGEVARELNALVPQPHNRGRWALELRRIPRAVTPHPLKQIPNHGHVGRRRWCDVAVASTTTAVARLRCCHLALSAHWPRFTSSTQRCTGRGSGPEGAIHPPSRDRWLCTSRQSGYRGSLPTTRTLRCMYSDMELLACDIIDA